MTFPILGGNGAVAGYSIDNSLRLNDGDTPRLTRTPSSQGNPRTFTFSCWVKKSSNGIRQVLFGADIPSQANASYIRFTDDDTLQAYFDYGNNTLEANFNSVAKFRDVSAFYHVVWATDTSLSTEADRVKLYVNGEQITDFQSPDYISQNFGTDINQTHPHYVGTDTVGVGNDSSIDGYLAEVHFIDGQQLSPTDFGEFDEDSGIWKPKAYDGSYGTNGFKLDFSNSSNFGEDFSGNNNDFTATNLASTDQTTDTPTNNFCTLNSIYINGASSNIAPTYSEGNTITNSGGSGTSATRTSSTFEFSSGKWYWEVKINDTPSAVDIGINNNAIGALCGIRQNGTYFTDNNDPGTLTSFTSGDIISFAFDMDNKKMYIAKNGTYMNSANPSTSTNGISFTTTDSMHCQFKSRQDDSLSANFGNPPFSITSGNSDDNGYGNFEYAPPSGYLALCTQNLATALSPTIDDGSAYFQTATYSGTGSSLSVVNDGYSDLQPDWIWLKCRTRDENHSVHDSTRGVDNFLASNQTNAEGTETDRLESFNTDGFTVNGGDDRVNISGATYVAWQWKANGGTTSSNTDGSITSTVQANQTAGFSVVTYTGTGANATVGHGLGKTPKIVIVKRRDANGFFWVVQHASIFDASDTVLGLDLTSASFNQSGGNFNGTSAGSSVFTLGSGGNTNQSGGTYIAYCFAEIEGYSSINSYTGNGSTDGTFVHTGFRPAWVMYKNSSSASNWIIRDDKRTTSGGTNPNGTVLLPNSSSAESTNDSATAIDLLSNGFKIRNTENNDNTSGNKYIYMAFGHTFVDSNSVPNTAR